MLSVHVVKKGGRGNDLVQRDEIDDLTCVLQFRGVYHYSLSILSSLPFTSLYQSPVVSHHLLLLLLLLLLPPLFPLKHHQKGGARGLAHLGVIKALEEFGVAIDMVGGTSQVHHHHQGSESPSSSS